MEAAAGQLGHAVRRLLRSPGFTLVSVFTLAVGIGANTAIFSVVEGVLLEPLPFDEPDRLVGIWHTAPGLGFDEVNQSPALHFTYVDEGRSFSAIGMWDDAQVTVTGVQEPEQVDAMRLTWGTLLALRVSPALGRAFSREDDTPGAPRTAILGYGYWRSRFGGDPGVLGRTVTVNGLDREIIGVMGEGFRFLQYDPALYLPFQWDRSQLQMGDFSYQSLARLAPGVTLEQADADLARMIPLGIEKFPGGLTEAMLDQAHFAPDLRPLKRDVVGDVGDVLWVLLGTVGMVLLIACANVANLSLVRAEGRQKEMAVRTALGAARGQVAGQLLLESVVLGLAGGLAGLALAFAGLKLLVALGPEQLPRLHEIGVDPTVLAFTLGISLLAGLFFGMFPAVRLSGLSLVTALKEGGRGGSDGRERHRARNALVVAQIALALVLLVGSGLMIRTFQTLRSVNPGFERPEEVLTFRLPIPSAEIEDIEEVARTDERILHRLEQIPGVTAVGLSSSITMGGWWDSSDAIFVENHPVPEGQLPPVHRFKWIAPGYVEAMGNRLLAGRTFTWADIHDRESVVVVTENFAREYWGDPARAVGKRIRQWQGSPWREIVGVVGDVYDKGVSEGPVAIVYWPMVVTDFWDSPVFAQRSMAYALRTSRPDPGALMAEARRAVWAENPNLPLANVRTLQEIVDRSMARTSFTLIMLGIAAAVALLLGAVGIYGVISYVVAQRTREIGVRVALGAESRQVSAMVLRQGLTLAALGLLVGGGIAVGLTRLMTSLLFGVDPLDPLTYGAVALSLTLVALLASWIPARRAAGVDPVTALHWD